MTKQPQWWGGEKEFLCKRAFQSFATSFHFFGALGEAGAALSLGTAAGLIAATCASNPSNSSVPTQAAEDADSLPASTSQLTLNEKHRRKSLAIPFHSASPQLPPPPPIQTEETTIINEHVNK